MDETVRAFVEAVKEKQKRRVIEVAAACAGEPVAEVETALHRRLAGMGATSAEIARWAEKISDIGPQERSGT